MAKRFFITSDTHSYFTPFKKALKSAGFRKTNKDDYLIIVGDVFDRGDESVEIFEYLMSIPKSRLIMIRGNHEDLLIELLKKETPDSYDYSNGTVKTICSFTGYDEYSVRYNLPSVFGPHVEWKDIVKQFKELKVYNWVADKKNWHDYYELGDYIITHSFIPLKCLDNLPYYYTQNRKFEYDKSWRMASRKQWEKARWGCPWKLFAQGLFDQEKSNGKTLVVGHWYSAEFFTHLDGVPTPITDSKLYRGNGIIALDACTALNNYCNILKIELE